MNTTICAKTRKNSAWLGKEFWWPRLPCFYCGLRVSAMSRHAVLNDCTKCLLWASTLSGYAINAVVVCCASSAVVVYALMSVDRVPWWHISVPWLSCACSQICCRVPLRCPILWLYRVSLIVIEVSALSGSITTAWLYTVLLLWLRSVPILAWPARMIWSCGWGVLKELSIPPDWQYCLLSFFLVRSGIIVCVCAVPNVDTHPHCVWIWASAEWITTTLYLKECRANTV